MSEPMLDTNIWCLVFERILHTRMSEPMLHIKILCLASEPMLCTKYMMFEQMLLRNMRLFSVWTNDTFENV